MPKVDDEEFFGTREDWSRRKHLVLGYYLKPAVAKLRRASPDNRVIILDAFAGPGRYDDNTTGSPVEMGRLADVVKGWADPVDLRIHNIEANAKNHASLEGQTKEWVEQGIITNHHSTYHGGLPIVLAEARSSPVFAFLDPFRPSDLPFKDIDPLLQRGGITEVLLLLHTPSILRIMGTVRPGSATDDKTRATNTKNLDAIFGGDHWHRFLKERPTPETVTRCYMEGLAKRLSSGGGSYYIGAHAIQVREDKHLKYHVIFITRHPAGIRLINDAFVAERKDVRSQAAINTFQRSLFDDDVKMPTEMHGESALIRAARRLRDRDFFFGALLVNAMLHDLGEYTEADFKRVARDLLQRTTGARLVGVDGNRLKSSGQWKVEDKLKVRFEEPPAPEPA